MKTARKRLLIVDDDHDALASLKLLLETSYDVCLADSGVQALTEINRGFYPDAVLLDLMMPTMDGMEFAREMARVGVKTPILVISGDPEAERKAREIGNAEMLRKPFTYEQLKAKLEHVLNGRQTPRSGGGLGFIRGLLVLVPSRLGGA
ncbi:MAG TPA: response regulator [Candidatus Omnitrophota bacterium]|jgi:DNA-binding response OmpR family regulator|nr:response regulator [Candidatus Omnitrophota bacterium]